MNFVLSGLLFETYSCSLKSISQKMVLVRMHTLMLYSIVLVSLRWVEPGESVEVASSSSLFALPKVSEGFATGATKGKQSVELHTTGGSSSLTGLKTKNLSSGELPIAVKTQSFKVHEQLAKTTFFSLPREQVQFFSCGASGFGNSIPQTLQEFIERTGRASKTFRNTLSDEMVENFSWSVPVEKEQNLTSKYIRWTDMTRRFGVKVQNPDPENAEIFMSDDRRFLLPKFKLSVKEDNSNAFDVFFFQHAVKGMPPNQHHFNMGMRSEFLDAFTQNVAVGLIADRIKAIESQADAIRYKEMQLVSEVGGLEPFFAFDEEAKPFVGLYEHGIQDAMKKTEEDLMRIILEKASEQETEEAKKIAILTSAANDISKKILDSDIAAAVAANAGMPKDLGRSISNLVDGITGKPKTPSIESQKLTKLVERMVSGDISLNELEPHVYELVKAFGVPQFRRLSAGMETEKELVLKSKKKAPTIIDERSPFLSGDLTIKNTRGSVVYGPVRMYCPYFVIPKSKIIGKGLDDVLVFEFALRSQEGEHLTDDLRRPIIYKNIYNRRNNLETEIDDKSKCPDQVLGMRILDVDYDDFNSGNTGTKEFVREIIASSLQVPTRDVIFCDAKPGSTIVAFHTAHRDKVLQWGDIVSSREGQVNRVLQLDTEFPSFIDKNDLYITNVPVVELDDVDAVEPEIETDTQSSYRSTLKTGTPKTATTTSSPPEEKKSEGGLPTWGAALISIIIIGVVVTLVVLGILYFISKRKLKKEDDVVGKPVEALEYPEGTEHVGVKTEGVKKQQSGIIQPDHKTATNRVGVAVEVTTPSSDVAQHRRPKGLV